MNATRALQYSLEGAVLLGGVLIIVVDGKKLPKKVGRPDRA